MESNFSSNLKRFRHDGNLSQAQLALKLGLTQRKVSYLESGKIEPDLQTLIAIAKYFDVTIDHLVGRED